MPSNEDIPLFHPPSGTTATTWDSQPTASQQSATQFLLLGAPQPPDALRTEATRALGFEPQLTVSTPFPRTPAELDTLVQHHTPTSTREIFVLPALTEFGLREREIVAEFAARLRRTESAPAVHYDEPRLDHPLVVQALADAAIAAMSDDSGRPEFPPDHAGLIVVARGDSDAGARASTYALMRLLWEQLGFSDARAAFLRHDKSFVSHVLASLPADGKTWLIVSTSLSEDESFQHLEAIVRDPPTALPNRTAHIRLARPPANHPALRALLVQRMADLYRQKRQQSSAQAPAPRHAEPPQLRLAGTHKTGLAAEIHTAEHLREILPPALTHAPRVFIKVTWHGYAPGTYTDPAALDILLTALDGQAVLLEGHTSSRNLGGATFDWETEARAHRAWIRNQEHEYLGRTGITEVLHRHNAQYLNVTEAFWDRRCLPAAEVREATGLTLTHDELLTYIPETLWENRGAPFLSFARFKGPTRLATSNLFGLIPEALRARWHGPNITYFAQVCCEIGRLYSAIFDCHALVEAFNTAVKWDKKGLYRSRWGNYDLLEAPKLATYSPGFAPADVLAARLQGQDTQKSAFYDVIEQHLGPTQAAQDLKLPNSWQQRLR